MSLDEICNGLGKGRLKVQELGPEFGQHDVTRLQIAVNDSRAMRALERVCDGCRESTSETRGYGNRSERSHSPFSR